jgi:hypothetical protein
MKHELKNKSPVDSFYLLFQSCIITSMFYSTFCTNVQYFLYVCIVHLKVSVKSVFKNKISIQKKVFREREGRRTIFFVPLQDRSDDDNEPSLSSPLFSSESIDHKCYILQLYFTVLQFISVLFLISQLDINIRFIHSFRYQITISEK